MLHIIAQFRQLFTSLMFTSFAEQFNADQFKNSSEQEKENILKNNTKAIIDYINSLDEVKDRIIVSNVNNKRLDDFSGTDYSKNMNNESNVRSILTKLGLDQNRLSDGVTIAEIVDKINEFA